MRNPFKSYWKLIDHENPYWQESKEEYDSLDKLKFRVEQITGLRSLTRPNEILLKAVLSHAGLDNSILKKFNGWQAIRSNRFKQLEVVDLEDWFTIRKIELS